MDSEIAVQLINTGRLTPGQLLEVGEKMDSPDIWRAVIEQLRKK